MASTCAFNLLTRAFNLPTRAFNLPTRAFNHDSQLVTRVLFFHITVITTSRVFRRR